MMLIGRKYSGVVCSVNQGARAGRRSARRRSQHHRCRGPEEREAEAAGEREAGAWRSRRAGCWREVWWGHGMGYKSRWTCIFASRCPLNTRRDRRRDRYKSCWMSFFVLFFLFSQLTQDTRALGDALRVIVRTNQAETIILFPASLGSRDLP